MKTIVISYIFILIALSSSAQRPQMVTRNDSVTLSELVILDSTFLKRIDDLSNKTKHPLNLYDGKPNMIFLSIYSDCNNPTSYTIYINNDEKNERLFRYVPDAWGFFELEQKLFVVNVNIPDLFKPTRFKTFNYTVTIGTRKPDGSILIMVPDEVRIDSRRVALKYTYQNGKVDFERIIEGW